MIRGTISSQLDKFVLEASIKYGVSYHSILSKSRRSKIVKARDYAINKMLMNTDARLRECGEFLGNRTPATIHQSFKRECLIEKTPLTIPRIEEKVPIVNKGLISNIRNL